MANAIDLASMVPGFDFFQGLMKNSGAVLPAMGQWVAPTLDPKELEKRIGELRTVQFWLEQNARLLGTTIQALEVQRMTLATLQTMNLPMADLRDSLRIQVPPMTTPSVSDESAAAPVPTTAYASTPEMPKPKPKPAPSAAGGTPAVDPLQWWGALTQQFTDLAAQAMKDNAAVASAKPAAPPVPAPAPSPAPASATARKARASAAKPAAAPRRSR